MSEAKKPIDEKTVKFLRKALRTKLGLQPKPAKTSKPAKTYSAD